MGNRHSRHPAFVIAKITIIYITILQTSKSPLAFSLLLTFNVVVFSTKLFFNLFLFVTSTNIADKGEIAFMLGLPLT